MPGLFKADTGTAVQLTDDNTLSAVDNKGAPVSHDGNVTHKDPFRNLSVRQFEQKVDKKRSIIDFTVFDAVNDIGLAGRAVTDLIRDELQFHLLVKALDREDLLKDLLEPLFFTLFRGHVALQEILVRINLKPDKIGNFKHVAQFAKVSAVRHYRPPFMMKRKIFSKFFKKN